MITPKKSALTYISSKEDIHNHIGRIVLAEKNISHEIDYMSLESPTEDFAIINPYHTLPVLIDRELILNEVGIIVEYLDERFPHPPLLPVNPVSRARLRTMMYRINEDCCSLAEQAKQGQQHARLSLRDQLIKMEPAFKEKEFFLSTDFTLIDCLWSALLWRLPAYGVEIAEDSPIRSYEKRLFVRDAFRQSLSEEEKQMRREFEDEF